MSGGWEANSLSRNVHLMFLRSTCPSNYVGTSGVESRSRRRPRHFFYPKPAGGVPPEFPNKWWVQRFVKRHKKELSWRKPQILDQKRADHSTEEIARGYASRLEPVLSGVAAECIWNCDETGVCAQGTVKTRVLCSRGLAANTRRSHDRENVTVMGCVNAAGGSIPPMYIFAGEHRKVRWLDEAVDGAVCAMTESSNINGNVFLYWLQFFVRKISAVRPQVLIMDKPQRKRRVLQDITTTIQNASK